MVRLVYCCHGYKIIMNLLTYSAYVINLTFRFVVFVDDNQGTTGNITLQFYFALQALAHCSPEEKSCR